MNQIVENHEKSLIISVSTKNSISPKYLKKIIQLNELLKKGKGFFKISVSITLVDRIEEIEPGASSYFDRLKTLSLLSENNILNSVILKPLLPFIPLSEYQAIIDQASKYTKAFLLGDLYIDKDTDFFKKYLSTDFELREKAVNWLEGKPVWKYIESSKLKAEIIENIEQKDLRYFESDLDLIKYLCLERSNFEKVIA